ncbi:serine hydrolase domain-containing protein [Bacillus aquiflavi]|uniref:serine hydrolase domain-containing protein n=1 Tax=Bacillus aquiflavi TaxID=2672567 RepID=UPI001FE30647|nr:serine hydrolase domain-containing protein [Bacillus aquiflavi]
MKLIEEGKLNIDDPVQKYIPTFTLKDQQAASQITIKHLLSHTSGLSPYIGLLMADKTSNDLNAIKSNLNNLINVNLTASPGEKYQYSSANYLILGALIEEVTNQPYSQFMEEHIFLPLQMKNAAADLETAREKGYFAGYQSWFGLPRKSEVVYDNGGAAYGYITASAKDMAQLINFFSEQGDSILSKEYKELYLSPLFQTKEEQYYGFGLRITDSVSQGKIIWHSGSTPDSHTEFFFLPETGWGGVILTNKNHILEEEALPNLKNGIIAILNGEKPADVQSIFPTVQLVLCGILCLLFGLLFYLIVKLVRKNIRKRNGIRSIK